MAHLEARGISTFRSCCRMSGVGVKPGKSEAAPSFTFLGRAIEFPAASNDFNLSISLPPPKRERCAPIILGHLKAGQLSLQELDKLIGDVSLSNTSLFGKFARAELRPIYQKRRRQVYCAILYPNEVPTFRWRR